jgi:hypothetical protein
MFRVNISMVVDGDQNRWRKLKVSRNRCVQWFKPFVPFPIIMPICFATIPALNLNTGVSPVHRYNVLRAIRVFIAQFKLHIDIDGPAFRAF